MQVQNYHLKYHIITASYANAEYHSISVTLGVILRFLPHRGDTLHRWGWNTAWRSLLHAKFLPNQCTCGVWGPKTKNVTKILAYKHPTGASPLGNLY